MKHLAKFSILFVVVFVFRLPALADEGMWLPQLLKSLNEKDMKRHGMKISADEIYNINKGSLKDAIVSFGGFCTAEVISDKGLLLTNHHCGFDNIQNHSSLQHNYIRDGFWARSHSEELPNPGLTATFIIRIDDVTAAVLKGVTAGMPEKERQSLVNKNIEALKPGVKKESYQDILIRPFFEGNKYYLFVTEVYQDVRLVGAPPSSIGNFGKDTDNWMWPRHNGDFSLFRIYAGKDNKPAAYSPDNVPYRPKRSLNISLDGVNENDFTMVFGFPGRTYEYLYSAAVEQIMEVNDPAKIGIRGKALGVLNDFMRADEQVKIQYAAKYASIENAYKKWQGEVLGLKRTGVIGQKKAYEALFAKRVMANPEWKQKYSNLLPELEKAYAEIKPFGFARDYYTEIISRIELFTIASRLYRVVNAFEKAGAAGYDSSSRKVTELLRDIYHEYNPQVDQRMFATLLQLFVTDQQKEVIAPELTRLVEQEGGNYAVFASRAYNASIFDDSAKVFALLASDPTTAVNAFRSDFAMQLLAALQTAYVSNVNSKLAELQNRVNLLQRTYMAAQMEVFPEKRFYPDANSTLRVAYGQAKGYQPRDAVEYGMYTYLDGVIQKYVPGDYEFDLPAKLIELYNRKDFGPYGVNGRQPVCFIATNHTTGGNSGSPALDAWGNLVGLNFDRVWEGTMSDIHYDADICRNIMVDIRYVAFIIDKFAGARNIIDELKFVHPKKGKN
ncbi:MAG TPA: S46 family peptidase [Chitinophagaceae bacterium]